MNSNFNDLPWHDATLNFIYIDRKNPGEQDLVQLSIEWHDSSNSSSIIEFIDCYALAMNMNFGVVACESILSAECLTISEELSSIRRDWAKAGINLDNLKCFKITTNSTNSIIKIFALNFRLIDTNSSIPC